MSPDRSAPPVVAVINTSPDTVDLLKDVLERAGMLVVTAFTHDIRDGHVNVEDFLRTQATGSKQVYIIAGGIYTKNRGGPGIDPRAICARSQSSSGWIGA